MALPKILRMLFANDGAGPKLRPDIIGITINNEESDSNGNFNVEIPYMDTSALVNKSGSRGSLAGYNSTNVTTSAITINQSSSDDTQVTGAVAITVANGTSGTAWTKAVSITNASATITLGDYWVWSGGEAPTVSANAVLVLYWNNDTGVANLVEGGGSA